MTMHFLVAHDLSPHSDAALQRAMQLALEHQAHLTVLHVAADADLVRHRQVDLEKWTGKHGNPQTEYITLHGYPSTVILQQIAGRQPDMVIVGRHHCVHKHTFEGTNLERLARQSPVPLLLVSDIDPAIPYTRALAAMDYSSAAARALRCACALLPRGASLSVLHILEVAEQQSHSQADSDSEQVMLEQWIQDECRGSELAISTRIVQGERGGRLDNMVQQERCQLLILGQRSRGVLADALLDSLAQKMLNHPPCDILVTG